MAIKSLVINPGSTSTKIGIFEDEELQIDQTLRHSTEEISQFPDIISQKDFRLNIILGFLKEKNIDVKSFDVIVGRGGLLSPIPGGTYSVNDKMIKAMEIHARGDHASNLGSILAKEIGDSIGKPSFIVDPTVVDELTPVARISGIPDIERITIDHPLNQKAMGRKYAKAIGKKYEDLNLVITHLGGGVSTAAHAHGQIIDDFGAFNGDGAFSPERANGIPALSLADLCYSGKYTYEEMKHKIIGGGGFNAYLGTNDAREIMARIEKGDEKAKLIMDAFIYQVSKNIGAMAVVLKGKVDQIIVTGGIAYNDSITKKIREYTEFIAPVTVYAGEDELLALAQGAIRVLTGEEKAKEYNG